jgi:hypothetical protein
MQRRQERPTMITEGETPERVDVHPEHAVVALATTLTTRRGVLPAGARGVVHDAKPDGSLYLVEFAEPFFCVVEVPGAAIRRA